MKPIRSLIALASITALATSASAVMTFTQSITGYPLDTLSSNDDTYYSNVFNNIKNGSNVLLESVDFSTYHIVSAVVEFGFADDGDSDYKKVWSWKGYEWVTDKKEFAAAEVEGNSIQLDGDEYAHGGVEVDGSHHNAPNNYDYKEGEIDSADFGDLEDGEAEFKITATKGDFYLKTAKITVTVDKSSTPPPHSVPDTGTTSILLGAALLGFMAIRRRLA